VPRRTKAEAAETREAIVLAARQLFGSQGYAATSTSAIATAAGVSQAGLFHHFPDKRAAFAEVVNRMVNELETTAWTAGLRQAATGDIRGAFLAGCQAALDVMGQPDFRQVVGIDGPAVLEREAWHALHRGYGPASIRRGFDQLKELGIIRAEVDLELMSHVFFTIVNQAAVGIAGDVGDRDRWMANIELLFDGIC
jgi:AcrR family transcriptional regulator